MGLSLDHHEQGLINVQHGVFLNLTIFSLMKQRCHFESLRAPIARVLFSAFHCSQKSSDFEIFNFLDYYYCSKRHFMFDHTQLQIIVAIYFKEMTLNI